jgi:hypothetical protein
MHPVHPVPVSLQPILILSSITALWGRNITVRMVVRLQTGRQGNIGEFPTKERHFPSSSLQVVAIGVYLH